MALWKENWGEHLRLFMDKHVCSLLSWIHNSDVYQQHYEQTDFGLLQSFKE